MTQHNFICDGCGITVQDHTTKRIHRCPKCGVDMRWDLSGVGIRQGDYYHVSDSLAIHPDFAVEHRKKFPQVDVLSDGRLGFSSPKIQERYANRCGFEKKAQRNRKKGVRIV